MQSDQPELLRRVLAELQIDAPIYGARSFADGRVEVYVYGGRKLTWPDDVQTSEGAPDPPTPLEPAILYRPPAPAKPHVALPDRDLTADIVAELGTIPLHKLSVWKLRHLAHLAGLHPAVRLKSIRKTQLVRELSEYRAAFEKNLRDSSDAADGQEPAGESPTLKAQE